MSKSKIRNLLLACALVVCILALLVGVTYALFSDRALVKNHLDAGKLEIKLERTKLTATRLNTTTGLLETPAANTQIVDFTGTNKENLFGLATDEKVAPGCSFVADMRLTNMGDVAFSFYVEIVLQNPSDAELASQLTVTVTCGIKTITQKLSTSPKLGSESNGIAVVLVKGTSDFTVKVSFDNLSDAVNNQAQNQSVNFDVIVHATQATGA